MSPYASIIIPTHDRAETLPCALRSALAQSVRDIEVVIAGDGCTDAARAVAQSFAAADARVRFLDRPKASHHGAANRHDALMQCRSERIFYSDDDDLLLPHHVEVLGAALDDADVVDTPPVSIDLDGSVMLGLRDTSMPVMRKMLAEEKYRGVYDTHLAHRKSAYLESSEGWLASVGHKIVQHMLTSMAANASLKWITLARSTALSFHGGARFGMSGEQRAAEIAGWETEISDPNFESNIRRKGSYVFHCHRLFTALASHESAHAGKIVDNLVAQLHDATEEQRETIRNLWRLLSGKAVSREHAAPILCELANIHLNPLHPTRAVIRQFLQRFDADLLSAWLSDCADTPAIHLARLHLSAEAKLPIANLSEIEAAYETIPIYRKFFFALCVAEAFQTAKDTTNVWKWLERVDQFAPAGRYSLGYWRLKKAAATKLGFGEFASLADANIASITEQATR